jgi:hypothetical protein
MIAKKSGKIKSRWTLRNDTGEQAQDLPATVPEDRYTGGQVTGDGRGRVRKSSKLKKVPISLTDFSL